MRLVADERLPSARPRAPFGREGVEKQVRDRLAVVGEHARASIFVVATEERRQVASEVVSAPPLKLVQQRRRPVALSGRIVHLVRIVEEGAEAGCAVPGERLIEPREILPNRAPREMIDDRSFAAGCGPLDHLPVPAEKQGVQSPVAGRGRPVERAVAVDARCEIDGVTGIAVRHQHDERQIAREPHLVKRQRLQIGICRDRFDEIRELNRTRASRRTWRWHGADGAEERRLTQAHRLGEPLSLGERPRLVRNRARARVVPDPGSAERPAGPGGQVDAEVQPVRLAQRVLEHAHPRVRQERDELRFASADAVDWRDLDAAYARVAQRLELFGQGSRIDRAAVPPPARPRLRLV